MPESDTKIYANVFEVIAYFVNNKLTDEEMFLAYDFLSDFLLNKKVEYNVFVSKEDRIRAQVRVMEEIPETAGKLTMKEKIGFAFCMYSAVCLQKYDEPSGTMKNGPTAALSSASKIDSMLIQWNYCVMINYFASVFKGNNGKETFKTLLNGYFSRGGMQHQPNVLDVEELKQAQLHPEKYKDLIVRLWGVSAHFVDLPKELQDEMISRFE